MNLLSDSASMPGAGWWELRILRITVGPRGKWSPLATQSRTRGIRYGDSNRRCDRPTLAPSASVGERPARGVTGGPAHRVGVLKPPLPPVTPREDTRFTRSAGHTVFQAPRRGVRRCDRGTVRGWSSHTVARSHEPELRV